MKGMREYFTVILRFGALFGHLNGLQCNTMVFIGVFKHDESLF